MPSKVMKSDSDSSAFLRVADDSVTLAAGRGSYIDVVDNGIHLSGPIAVHTGKDSVRYGALFTDIPFADWMHMLPSTLVTPFPTSVFNPPIQGIIGVAGIIAGFSAMLLANSLMA